MIGRPPVVETGTMSTYVVTLTASPHCYTLACYSVNITLLSLLTLMFFVGIYTHKEDH